MAIQGLADIGQNVGGLACGTTVTSPLVNRRRWAKKSRILIFIVVAADIHDATLASGINVLPRDR